MNVNVPAFRIRNWIEKSLTISQLKASFSRHERLKLQEFDFRRALFKSHTLENSTCPPLSNTIDEQNSSAIPKYLSRQNKGCSLKFFRNRSKGIASASKNAIVSPFQRLAIFNLQRVQSILGAGLPANRDIYSGACSLEEGFRGRVKGCRSGGGA